MNSAEDKLARTIWGEKLWEEYKEYCQAKADIEEDPLDIDSFIDFNKTAGNN